MVKYAPFEAQVLDAEILSDAAQKMQNFLLSTIIGQDRAVNIFTSVFQQIMVGMHREGRPCGVFLFSGPTGTGKCMRGGTPVLMHDGSIRAIEHIKKGDWLMGPDSKPRIVLNTVTDSDELFEIRPVKGESFTINKEHILSLKYTNQGNRSGLRKGQRRSTKDGTIINIPLQEYIKKSKTFHHITKLYRVPINFSSKEVPLDPYFLGLWLGDGNSDGPAITTIDDEIKTYLYDFAKKENVIPRWDEITLHLGATSGQGGKGFPRCGRNPVLNKLRSLSVLNNKHIPLLYKANSRSIRLQILAGLMDSDGSKTCGGYDFISISKILAEDTAYLCRSLGLAAYVKKCKKKAQTGVEGTYYRVFISGDVSMIPVKINHKKQSFRKQKKNVLVTGIKEVKSFGVDRYYGFTLSGDGLFLLGDFTVTHNTQLVRRAAEFVLGNQEAITRIDCGEFQEHHEVAKLIGSPPGYVGYSDKESIRLSQSNLDKYQTAEHKINFLLFDEIEEAHESLLAAILQILDAGRLTLGNGGTTDFTKTIVVLTSNLGEKEMQQVLSGGGLGLKPETTTNEDSVDEKIYKASKRAAVKYFQAKFINRIDRHIVFRQLSEESLQKILRIELNNIQMRVWKSNLIRWEGAGAKEPFPVFRPLIKTTDAACSFLIKEGSSKVYGARELNRALDRFVSFPLGSLIGSNQLEADDIVEVDYKEGDKKLIFTRIGKRDIKPIKIDKIEKSEDISKTPRVPWKFGP